MYRDLEFVCGGENGRSPIAAAVARKYCSSHNEMHEITIRSSGTRVDFLKTATPEQVAQAIKPYITTALSIGIVTEEQAEQLRQGKSIKEILYPLLNSLADDETKRRNEILSEKGLRQYGDIEKIPTQTKVRMGAELIFPIGEENKRIVSGMYARAGMKGLNPEIICLGEFEDTFFMDLAGHRRIADQIEQATIKALERYL